MSKDIAASIHQRLLNHARKEDVRFNDVLQRHSLAGVSGPTAGPTDTPPILYHCHASAHGISHFQFNSANPSTK